MRTSIKKFLHILKLIGRSLLYFIGGLLLILLVLYGLIHVPKVQHYLVEKTTSFLSNKLQTKVKIQGIDIDPFKTVVLKGVYIEDRKKDTLLYAEKMKADLGLLSLSRKEILLSYFSLQNARINLYKANGKDQFNYEFIVEAFTSENIDTTAEAWNFEVDEIKLNNVYLTFYDGPGKTDLDLKLKEAVVDIKTLGLEDQHLVVDNADLDGVFLSFTKLKGEMNPTGTQEPTPPWSFSVNEGEITQSQFILNNENIAVAKEGIDYEHLYLSKINGKFEDIDILPGGYGAEIRTLAFNEKSGFTANEIVGKFNATDTSFAGSLDKFITPNSLLNNRLSINIPSFENINKYAGEIEVLGDFKNDTIAIKDVAYFVPDVKNFDQLKNKKISISGNLKGKVKDLSYKNAKIYLDKKNFLIGDFEVKGLPEINTAKIEAKFEQLQTNSNFIKSFLPADVKQQLNVDAFGNIALKGVYKGTIRDFTIDAKIRTSAGTVTPDLVVKLDTNFTPQKIKGKLGVNSLQLGRIIQGKNDFGPVSFTANFTAKGNDLTEFVARVSSFHYKDYTYNNIVTQGSYKDNITNAIINVQDKNLTAYLKGKVNLNSTPFEYNIEGEFKEVNLHPLNLYDTPLTISTNLKAHLTASVIDSLRGNVFASELTIQNDKYKYYIDSIHIKADYQNATKYITFNSPVLNADVSGKFSYEELPAASQHLLSHYFSAFKGPGHKDVHLDNIYFKINSKNLKGLTQVFLPDVKELSDINIEGSFEEKTHLLKVKGSIGEINMMDKDFTNINIALEGNKEALAFDVSSNSIALNKNIQFANPKISGKIKDDKVNFNLQTNDEQSGTSLSLAGALTYNNDTYRLTLPEAEITLKGKEWELAQTAQIIYSPNTLRIQDFTLQSGEEKIAINTNNLSGNKSILYATLTSVQLDEISKLVGLTFPIQGAVNGEVKVVDVLNEMGVNADLSIKNLVLNNVAVGDINLDAQKPTNSGRLQLNATVDGQAGNAASIAGYINIDDTKESLNLAVNIESLNTKSIEPFVKEFAYGLSGTLQANLKVSGTMENPILLGNALFKGTHTIGITQLQTVYKVVNEEISFTNNAILLDEFAIQDIRGNSALVKGKITHEDMQNFYFDISLVTEKFQFLNNKKNAYIPFSGDFFARANATVKGPLENLDIVAEVTTLPKTNITMGFLTQQVSYQTPDYINFVTPKTQEEDFKEVAIDTLKKSNKQNVAVSRFNVSLILNITEDAVINIPVDEKNGDQITAAGKGSLQVSLGIDDQFNIFGKYEITEGNYTFTFANLVKKEFDIEKGSTIRWYGNPEDAAIDITAVYKTKASRYDLVQDQLGILSKEQISAARRPMPVFVYLYLDGSLDKPDLTFDIVIPEGSGDFSNSAVVQRLNQIKGNENELNRQVLGLIAFNKFLPIEGSTSFSPYAGSTAGESVSDLLNSQLDRLGEKYLEGVELDVNVENNAGTSGTENVVNISASKRINDRITISAGRRVGGPQSTSGLAGDYSILYRLNKEGNLNFRFFRNSQTNIYTNDLYNIQGVSISHFKSFNSFKELFGIKEGS